MSFMQEIVSSTLNSYKLSFQIEKKIREAAREGRRGVTFDELGPLYYMDANFLLKNGFVISYSLSGKAHISWEDAVRAQATKETDCWHDFPEVPDVVDQDGQGKKRKSVA